MSEEKIAVCLDLGGTNLRGALVTQQGKILHRTQLQTDRHEKQTTTVEQIFSVITQLITWNPATKKSVAGVCMALPGPLVEQGRQVYFAPNLPHLAGRDIGKILQDEFPFPCRTENDANCAVLGEWRFGSARGFQHVVLLTLGTGIGGGIIADGKLLRGSRGAAGEIGHICVEPEGPPCGCGSRGCLEAMASGISFERNTGQSGKAFFESALSGDEKAKAAFDRMGHYLGIALASLCSLFDPQIIVLGGKLASASTFFLPSVSREMLQRLPHHPGHATPIIAAQLGDDAGLLGASSLLFSAGLP